MTIIFSDGFESNDFSAWTGTGGSVTHNEIVENLNPHHGTYNAKFYLADTNSESWAYKDITNSPIVHYREYCKFSALPANNGEIIYGALLRNAADGGGVSYFITNAGGNLYWGLYVDGPSATEVVPSNPVVDTWYCIEILRDVTNNIETLWVNDEVKVNQTFAIVNNTDRLITGVGYISYATVTSVFVDCCVASDSYIGPETSGPRFYGDGLDWVVLR